MPRISYINTKANKRSKAVEALKSISKMFRSDCATGRKFAEVLGTSSTTAWRRLEYPAEMTLNELITASVNLGYGGSISLQNEELSVEVKW